MKDYKWALAKCRGLFLIKGFYRKYCIVHFEQHHIYRFRVFDNVNFPAHRIYQHNIDFFPTLA